MSQRQLEFFLCVIGMVMVIEGLPYFGFPEKMKELMRIIQEQDDFTLRVMGGLLMLFGLTVVFLARKGLSSL
jgi:uncharacterized protein YjeT (DUF2065 family)